MEQTFWKLAEISNDPADFWDIAEKITYIVEISAGLIQTLLQTYRQIYLLRKNV